MKKKIALMTWHHVQNYGTAFQAYALKTTIEKMGFSVDLIDYKRKNESPIKKCTISSMFFNKIKAIKKKSSVSTKQYKFPKEIFDDFFDKYFTYTFPCEYNQDFYLLNKEYCGFVCGSDQIWGPEWLDERFFLDFVLDNSKKVAYAPSFGVDYIDDRSAEEIIKRRISDFKYLSLREKSGCNIAKKMTRRQDIQHVLDPVLLLEKKEWKEMCEENVDIPASYMLIFFLKNNEEYFNVAIKIAELLGLKPLIMHCTQSEDNIYVNIKKPPTPKEILTYIRNASYVCTDSFHVTVLSIIFNIEFLVFKKNGCHEINAKNGRITNLLEVLGIENHEYDGNIEKREMIDYEIVNKKLIELRNKSTVYLKQALNDISLKCEVNISSTYSICKKMDLGCSGELNLAYLRRKRKAIGIIDKFLLNMIDCWNFSLKEECYGCKYYIHQGLAYNIRKPLFYYELIQMLNDDVPLIKIYWQYYLTFDIKKIIKVMLGK